MDDRVARSAGEAAGGVAAMLRVRPLSDAEWPGIALRFRDLTYEQTMTYARPAAARIGGEARLVAIERPGAPDAPPVAAAAVRVKKVPGLGRGIAWIPAGPLAIPLDGPAPDDETLIAILAALREHFCGREGHILRFLTPGVAFHDRERFAGLAAKAGFAPTDRARRYRSFAIDLAHEPEELMKRLHGKWRTDLRYALKSGLTLETGAGLDMQARFLRIFDVVKDAKGFAPDIAPEFHFGLEGLDYRLDILMATKDGEDLGGIVTGTSGASTVYLFGATGDGGRRLRTGYFLTWKGILMARERGCAWYDLGGVDFDANPDVARFKDRMNGEAIDAAGPFEARPRGIAPHLVGALESLRARLKRG